MVSKDKKKYYSLCPIRNETFSCLGCPNKNETFPKIETTLSLLFLLSYFTLSSLTHKTPLHKILCQKANVAYLLERREYLSHKEKHKITITSNSGLPINKIHLPLSLIPSLQGKLTIIYNMLCIYH